jgi:hypothetical protein
MERVNLASRYHPQEMVTGSGVIDVWREAASVVVGLQLPRP